MGTYRANEVANHPSQRGRLAELTRLPAAHRIQLDGLDPDEVAQRVASLLGGAAPSALVDQVVARGRGNPFFTSELVAAHLSGEAIPHRALRSDLHRDRRSRRPRTTGVGRGRDDRPRHEPSAARRGRRPHRARTRSRRTNSDRLANAGRRTTTPTASVTRCSAKSCTPTCCLRNEPACIAASRPRCSSRRPMRCDERTVPVSWRSTSTVQATPLRRSRRCSRPPMRQRRSLRLQRSRTSSVPSSCGIRPAKPPPRSIVVIDCGRPPTSPLRQWVTSEPCNWRERPSSTGRLRSERRGAMNGSGATCGPLAARRRAAPSSRRRSRC